MKTSLTNFVYTRDYLIIFYRKRKQGQRNVMDRQYREASNPQRATKRQAQRNRDKYHYDIAQ